MKIVSFAKTTFGQRVVQCALSVPAGRVTTYGDIARAAGGGHMAAQGITGILARAYKNGETGIPFHRIVYANGKIWTSPEYAAKRRALYKKEGIEVDDQDRIVNFRDILYEF
jgi:methylated-DNA-protein-cysteine methyltransferase-like protein